MKNLLSGDDLSKEIDSQSRLVVIAFLGNAIEKDREIQLLYELESEYPDTVCFCHVSTKAVSLYEEYRIKGEPVYFFFHRGEIIERILGSLSKKKFKQIWGLYNSQELNKGR